MGEQLRHQVFPPGWRPSHGPLYRSKWRRELYLLRRDGLIKYVKILYHLHRFHRSVRALEHDDA